MRTLLLSAAAVLALGIGAAQAGNVSFIGQFGLFPNTATVTQDSDAKSLNWSEVGQAGASNTATHKQKATGGSLNIALTEQGGLIVGETLFAGGNSSTTNQTAYNGGSNFSSTSQFGVGQVAVVNQTSF